MVATKSFRGTAQDDNNQNIFDQYGELLHWDYVDTAGTAGEIVMTASRRGGSNSGLINTSGLKTIIVSIKNNQANLTWDGIPKFRGTNDPLIVNPTVGDGFDLDIGSGKAVDKAFAAIINQDEEQSVIIDCDKAPNGIFLVGNLPAVRADLDIFVKLNRK